MRREVRELLDRRRRTIQQCRSIHEKAESENRALTAEEQHTYDQHRRCTYGLLPRRR